MMNPANHTSAMIELLGEFRRERNGLVADTMHYEGARYGLNYGVSLPTVRSIVRSRPSDTAFARFLYGQDVRCLQLAALHLADPETLADSREADFWLAGIRNSELAEEAAFALFSRSSAFPMIFATRLLAAEPLQCYLLLMAAARSSHPDSAWLDASLQRVLSFAEHPFSRLLANGLVALWAQSAASSDEGRQKTAEALAALGSSNVENHLREELSWRLE